MSLSLAVKVAIWSGSAIATGVTAGVVAVKKTEAGKKAWDATKAQTIKIFNKTKNVAVTTYDGAVKAVEIKKNEIKDKVDVKTTLETLRTLAKNGNVDLVMELLKKEPQTIVVEGKA
jgi:hypothetical protein